jgi:hypothetical protein
MKKQVLTAVCGLGLLLGTAVAGAQVVVRIGPPPPHPREVPPPPPHEGWVWHEGYHRWDGAHYVWVPGEYVEPPHPHARWIPGHWDHRGGGYVWVEGHWR